MSDTMFGVPKNFLRNLKLVRSQGKGLLSLINQQLYSNDLLLRSWERGQIAIQSYPTFNKVAPEFFTKPCLPMCF